MVNFSKSLIPALLTSVLTPVSADIQYDDTNLHRSDELVRFDHAYRTGLKDGTTTIIYSASAEGAKEAPDLSNPSVEDPESRKKREIQDYDDEYDEEKVLGEYPRMTKDGYKVTERNQSSTDRSRTADQDFDTQSAPKSEPAPKGEPVDGQDNSTEDEQLTAIREARDLLKESLDKLDRTDADGEATQEQASQEQATCNVERGTLRENLERISDRYQAQPIFWGPDFDVEVEVDAFIGSDIPYEECVSVVVTSLQSFGAPIQAVSVNNGILIEKR